MRHQFYCRSLLLTMFAVALGVSWPLAVCAQSVCLPAPRLLTTMPMGGQVGSEFEMAITGEHLEPVEELLFSTPKISARPLLDDKGVAIKNRFLVSIADDCSPGLYEARVMARLGVSSCRIFTVDEHAEVTQTAPSTSLEAAFELPLDTICNATVPARGINYYRFTAQKDQRLLVDCAAKGIDSKMNPVVVVGDAEGRDLVVERRGGAIDFRVPADGEYTIKVHDLTFNGGAAYFYRLALLPLERDAPIVRQASTRAVNSFSWPPAGLPAKASEPEVEPNDDRGQAITLPCDIAGSFYPAADVDTYQFSAAKGEQWWVEVASERLGRPTDAAVILQRKVSTEQGTVWTDVTELSDIASPIKRSSNGYSYDGPPYNAGSTDVLGKIEIPADGEYRLRVLDLFGGTRNDPANVYRLVVRRSQPDFAIVAWALHMNLRNGDRNALSKPIALRGGSTMPLEVVAVRRDGFEGPIHLSMDQLPTGVTATGITIPAGQSRGIMLLTAGADAPRGLGLASFVGRAEIDGKTVERPCHYASMAWPVPNAWSEIPSPRLMADIPVSVGGAELAALTLQPAEDKVFEVAAGEKLTIPLRHVRRGEFSGDILALSTFGVGFDRHPRFEVKLSDDQSAVVLDLATLKPGPGEHTIAFYGSAVAKYRDNLDAVAVAELRHQQAAAQLKSAAAADRAEAEAALKAAADNLAQAKRTAAPKDIVDIYVSDPIRVKVLSSAVESTQ